MPHDGSYPGRRPFWPAAWGVHSPLQASTLRTEVLLVFLCKIKGANSRARTVNSRPAQKGPEGTITEESEGFWRSPQGSQPSTGTESHEPGFALAAVLSAGLWGREWGDNSSHISSRAVPPRGSHFTSPNGHLVSMSRMTGSPKGAVREFSPSSQTRAPPQPLN